MINSLHADICINGNLHRTGVARPLTVKQALDDLNKKRGGLQGVDVSFNYAGKSYSMMPGAEWLRIYRAGAFDAFTSVMPKKQAWLDMHRAVNK